MKIVIKVNNVINFDTIDLLNLCILNDASTTRLCRPGTVNSALDLCFFSRDLMWNTTWSTLNKPHSSDHIPILFSITNFSSIHDSLSNQNLSAFSTNSYYFNFTKANWNSFSLHIQNYIISLPDTLSSSLSYSNFTNLIDNAAKFSIPSKKQI